MSTKSTFSCMTRYVIYKFFLISIFRPLFLYSLLIKQPSFGWYIFRDARIFHFYILILLNFSLFCHQFSEIFPYWQEFTSNGPPLTSSVSLEVKKRVQYLLALLKATKRPFPKQYLWLCAWTHNTTSSWLNQTWHHFNFLYKVFFTHITIKIFKKLPVGVISIISCWCDTFWNDWKSN